jgi:hypothetical protein
MLHFALELSPLEKARFQVDQPFKGLVGAEKQVMVLTNRNTAACGFGSFDVGKSYVVYASRQRGNLYTGLCDGTKPSENASVDLGVLRAPRKGGCAGCAAGQGGAAGGGALVALLVAALTATRGRSARRRAARRRG